jgi:hypothetical protein
MRIWIALALVLSAAPARAGAPAPFLGVRVTQADLVECDETTLDGAVTLTANVPDDGRTWSWAWFSEADDGASFASVGDGQFALLPTAGDEVLENTGSLLVGPSLPGALGASYDFLYTVDTYVDGVLVLRSTITSRCEQGAATPPVFETRLAPPSCGPPVTACDVVVLPNATFRLKEGDDGKLTLKASGDAAPVDHFADPTLALADGGATTATCFYDSTNGQIGGLFADAALLNAKDKPLWKRKSSATKVTQRYADPKGEEGALRSLAQTSGAKAKLALTARGTTFGAAQFTTDGFYVQQRTVIPRDRVFACTEVYFPPGTIQVDAAKGTVKAKMKIPGCGPGCP